MSRVGRSNQTGSVGNESAASEAVNRAGEHWESTGIYPAKAILLSQEKSRISRRADISGRDTGEFHYNGARRFASIDAGNAGRGAPFAVR